MTEQEKREKVIKGLKYLHDVRRWSPDESEESITARRNITGDALALLKAQEPWVMTLEEVIESEVGTVVWLEDIDKPTVIAGLVDRVFTGTMVVDFQCVARTVTAGFDDYGKRWRCWTKEPTEAEREVTPWN